METGGKNKTIKINWIEDNRKDKNKWRKETTWKGKTIKSIIERNRQN